jgi:hypothetical protein
MRGTGTLALISGELVFLMWVPQRELRIPREAIESVDSAHGVAGKRVGGKALHVRWRSTEDVDEGSLASEGSRRLAGGVEEDLSRGVAGRVGPIRRREYQGYR